MSVSTIANRYARALADVIIERRETNEVTAELESFARVLAVETQSNASLLTLAGLLQRAVDLVALRALAAAELASGQRLDGP